MDRLKIYQHVITQRVKPDGACSPTSTRTFQPTEDDSETKFHQKHTGKLHRYSVHTSIPLAYVKEHQRNIRRSLDDADHEEGKNAEFSIRTHIQPTKFSERKFSSLDPVFTNNCLDVHQHLEQVKDLSDVRLQDPEWFERVVLLRDNPSLPFEETFSEDKPATTFINTGYSQTTIDLLNELSNLRYVTQQISRSQQNKNPVDLQTAYNKYESLYPHL